MTFDVNKISGTRMADRITAISEDEGWQLSRRTNGNRAIFIEGKNDKLDNPCEHVVGKAFKNSRPHLEVLGVLYLCGKDYLEMTMVRASLPFSPYRMRWHHRFGFAIAKKLNLYREIGWLAVRYAPQMRVIDNVKS